MGWKENLVNKLRNKIEVKVTNEVKAVEIKKGKKYAILFQNPLTEADKAKVKREIKLAGAKDALVYVGADMFELADDFTETPIGKK